MPASIFPRHWADNGNAMTLGERKADIVQSVGALPWITKREVAYIQIVIAWGRRRPFRFAYDTRSVNHFKEAFTSFETAAQMLCGEREGRNRLKTAQRCQYQHRQIDATKLP